MNNKDCNNGPDLCTTRFKMIPVAGSVVRVGWKIGVCFKLGKWTHFSCTKEAGCSLLY